MSPLHHHVYVIELDELVRCDGTFARENPDCSEELPCVYVGITGLTPEQRFARHKAGVQSSRIVKRFGIRLLPHLYEDLNPMTYEDAAMMEIQLAEELRAGGFGVWQK